MQFNFTFSLSIIHHLGLGLYRSFATVIAEAISNSWDAEATSVNVEIEGDSLTIWDSGVGMNEDDLHKKFFNIGYNRRRASAKSVSGLRHVLGRKGIGKLAYLLISKEVTIITQKEGGKRICVRISKKEIDDAIANDQDPMEWNIQELPLAELEDGVCKIGTRGTQLVFNGLKDSLQRHNIRAILATQFHFSHVLNKEGNKDKFQIYVKDKNNKKNAQGKIDIADLKDIYSKVQFAWFFSKTAKKNFFADMNKAGISLEVKGNKGIKCPDKEGVCKDLGVINRVIDFSDKKGAEEFKDMDGYILSVIKPSDLCINTTEKEFKASVAIFTGGRMRESELVGGKVSKTQLPEHYLFGQIHVDSMEGKDDRFASNREGFADDDQGYERLTELLDKILEDIIDDWNEWRPDGDTPQQKAEKAVNRLFALANNRHKLPSKAAAHLQKMARQNVPIYMDCFIAENMMRYYVLNRGIDYSNCNSLGHRESEGTVFNKAGDPIVIRAPLFNTDNDGISYLSSQDMASIIDEYNQDFSEQKTRKKESSQYPKTIGLENDNNQPLRNAVMHTSLLTDDAKSEADTGWGAIIQKISKWLRDQGDE